MSNCLFTVYSSREAAELWELSENTVTQWCNRGRFESHEARKSGKIWLVTREGMERLTHMKMAFKEIDADLNELNMEWDSLIEKEELAEENDDKKALAEIEKEYSILREKINTLKNERNELYDKTYCD